MSLIDVINNPENEEIVFEYIDCLKNPNLKRSTISFLKDRHIFDIFHNENKGIYTLFLESIHSDELYQIKSTDFRYLTKKGDEIKGYVVDYCHPKFKLV